MKFSLNRDDLLPALERTVRLVERRNTIPVLANIKICAVGDAISLTATDLDMQATSTVPADIAQPGETTLPAATLLDFVKKLPSAVLTIETQPLCPAATVKSGRSRATLNTLPAEDFPDLSLGAFTHSFDLAPGGLSTMIERVDFAISTEETRYYLNGIYLHAAGTGDAQHLRAVATDGHRLAQHQIALPDGAAGMAGIILPRKAVSEIARLIKSLKDPLRIEVSPTKLRLTAGGVIFATKLIDGTYPDYGRVIPGGNDRIAKVEIAALGAAVALVSTISSDRGRAVKFAWREDGLTLSVITPDTGEARDEVDAEFAGDPLEIGFNAAYVADILGALPGTRATLAMADPGSPCLITAEGDPASLFVLMPMRV